MAARNNNKHANIKHGFSYTRVYHIWLGMKQRCGSKAHISYQRYGARGIKVCERWGSFENFLADMGLPPSESHQLDRIDQSGNYEAINCRWVTPKQNSRNTRRNRLVFAFGKSQCVTAWAEEVNLSAQTIYARLKYGWSSERALSEPATRSRVRRQSQVERDARSLAMVGRKLSESTRNKIRLAALTRALPDELAIDARSLIEAWPK